MANSIFDSARMFQLGSPSTIAWQTQTFQVALMSTNYTPVTSTGQVFWSDISASETTGTAYTTKGNTVAMTVSNNSTLHHGVASPTTTSSNWAASTITSAGAVLFVSSTTVSNSPLIGWIDFGATKTSSGGNFTIVWDATNGVAYLS